MSTIGSAYVQVRADTSRFRDDAKAGVSKVGPALEAAAGLALKAGTVATGALTAIATFGLKSAASIEQTQTAFTGLLGSSTAASNQIKQLQDYAAKTPFEQQDVFNFAQQYFALAGSVGLAKDQVIPFLDAVGNVGAVTGAGTEGISAAVRAIAQMGSAGKITTQDLNQLSANLPGFNGAAAIASATGKTTAQVMDEISAGTLSAQDGVKALVEGMQKFPGAAGAMEAQSQTLNGVLSTFTDTIKISLTQSLTSSIPIVKSTLATLTPVIGQVLDKLGPALGQLIGAVGPLLVPLVQGLGSVLTLFAYGLVPIFQALLPVVQPIFDALSSLTGPLLLFAQLAAKVAAVILPPLAEIVTIIGGVFGELAFDLSEALVPVLPVIGDLLNVVADVLRQLLPVLEPVIGEFAGAFVEALSAIAPIIPPIVQLFSTLAKAVLPIVTTLLKAISPVLGILAQAFGQIAVALQPVVEALGQALQEALKSLGPALPEIADAFVQLALALAQLVVALAPLLPPLGQLLALAVTIGADAIVLIIKGFTKLVEIITGIVGPAVDGLAPLLSSLAGFFTDLYNGAVKPLVDFFVGVFAAVLNNTVVPALKGVGEAVGIMADVFRFGINNIIKPVLKFLLDLFFTVVGGIVKGAASAFGWVPGVGGKLKSAAKEFDKFHDQAKAALDGVAKAGDLPPPTIDTRTAREKLLDLKAIAEATKTALYLTQQAGTGPSAKARDIQGARASGGPVSAGSRYQVNERGIETFVPGTDGFILNAELTAAAFGGGARGGDGAQTAQLVLQVQKLTEAVLVMAASPTVVKVDGRELARAAKAGSNGLARL